ncbi:hypothetical protein BDV59DRAFT_187873 [Aspergillus ambiguus]|uniref:uncharacterized protein n=1 Tax=Aspergillus ambiguus TaxID=176160 RepID=UPI003CCDA38B
MSHNGEDRMEIDLPTTPSRTRVRRSSTIVGTMPLDETYNELSQQRKELLDRLHAIIGRPVPRVFWAVIVFSDLNKLEQFIVEVEKSSYLLDFCMHACAAISLLWAQKGIRTPGSSQSSSEESNNDASPTPRKKRNTDLARERDGEVCLFKKTDIVDVAHIYPHYLIAARKTNFTTNCPPFWNMLGYFWSEHRIKEWHDSIFTDLRHPTRPVDSVFNLMTISPEVHRAWSAGSCAFRPLDYNADKTTLKVEWHWQPTRPRDDKVCVNMAPGSSRALDHTLRLDGSLSSEFGIQDGDSFRRIHTGDQFTFSTTDPERLPLPSKALLDMQFMLTRVVNLAGAGEWLQHYYDWDHSDGEGPDIRIPRWLQTLSASESDDGQRDDDEETEITSGYPSPVKTRERVEAMGLTTMEQALFSEDL